MSAITYGRFIFGTGFFTPIPTGWELVENPDDWLIAVDPDGNEHFVTAMGTACPKRTDERGTYVDARIEIDLTK